MTTKATSTPMKRSDNLSILKRQTFANIVVNDGDRIEVVNFVGGG